MKIRKNTTQKIRDQEVYHLKVGNWDKYHLKDEGSGRLPPKRLEIRENTTQKCRDQEEYHPTVWVLGRIPFKIPEITKNATQKIGYQQEYHPKD